MNKINFPDELVWKFFSLLPAKEVCIAGRVCKYWHAISRDDGLWRLLTQEAELPFASSNDITPYDNYRLRIRPFSLISSIKKKRMSPLIISINELINREWPICKAFLMLTNYKGNYLFVRDHYSTELHIIDLSNPYLDKVKVQHWDNNANNLVPTRIDDAHFLFRQHKLHKILNIRTGLWVTSRKLENSDSSVCTSSDTIYFINKKENTIKRWDWQKDKLTTFFEIKKNLLSIDLSKYKISSLFTNRKLLVAYLESAENKKDRFLIWKLNEKSKIPAVSGTFIRDPLLSLQLKIRGDYLIFNCRALQVIKILDINKVDTVRGLVLSNDLIRIKKLNFELMKNRYLIVSLNKALRIFDLKDSEKKLSIADTEELKLKKIGIYLRAISSSENIYKIDYENGRIVKQNENLGFNVHFGTSTLTSYQISPAKMFIWGANPPKIWINPYEYK